MPATSQSMALGVIVERRDINHPWQRYRWQAVGVIPGADPVAEPRLLCREPGWVQYHVATLAATIHRTETEGYKRNLANQEPVVYVVMSGFDGDSESDIPAPRLVTVCPYEAQDYLDAGDVDEAVEAIAMPEDVQAWVKAYIDEHHVDEPFYKRKRKKWKTEEPRRQPPPGQGGRMGRI